MRKDTDGVGGFFEDLPVLMLVLAGVSSVVLACAWSIESRMEADAAEELEYRASALVDAAVHEASGGGSHDIQLETLVHLNLSGTDQVSRLSGWAVVVHIVHPWDARHIVSAGPEGPPPALTGWARQPVNVLYNGDMVAMAEVTAIVW